MRRLFLGLGCLAAAACPAPSESTPQVTVIPGKAGLWDKIFAPHDAAPSKPARVHVMREGEQLGGPNAIGRPGDLLLENDEVAFVVDRLGSSTGFAESGGNIVDAADARVRKDELGQQFTYFGKFPRQGVYSVLTSGTSGGGAAWIEARGRELYDPNLEVTTRYTLQPSDRALLLETTVKNAGAAEAQIAGFGDVIQWGGTEKLAPGKARGFKGRSSGPYVGGVGRFTSYATTSVEGTIEGTSGGSWTDTIVRAGVALGPGQQVTFARIFLVGERADTSSLVTELMESAGSRHSLGTVSVELKPSPGEAAIEVASDARIAVRDGQGADVLTIHAAGSPPRLEAQLPIGRWVLAYAGGGGRTGTGTAGVDVSADAEAHAELAVTRAANVAVLCASADGTATPCKVTFEPTDGGPLPDFGPAHLAGPARNQATTADGTVDVALAPGAYRVTASRGPEYALAQADVSLAPGERRELRLSPRRVVDTTGYLACDFHQHTVLGADSAVTTRDRIIANAAEGVEVAVASEHNVIADLEPMVRALGLQREMVSIAGDELTSDASLHSWGHANVFPLPFEPGKPRGGAPAVRDRTPGEIIDELHRTRPAEFVFQVNHPRSGESGYFDQLAFDPATGAGTGAGYDGRFDALEVWNGRNVDARGKVLRDFLALLRTSHPTTPTANTDTHGIAGQEAGYPRTYVRVESDSQLETWDAGRTAQVVRGLRALRDVVLTNGPMLRVTANGAPIGGTARGRLVEVRVHVESAPWVVVDEIRLLRASEPDDAKRTAINQTPTPRGALAADAVFQVHVPVDDAFVVIASGHRPLSPVLSAAAGETIEVLPWAMTGAIWVDADGDGRALGR
jgi:hypothetical protein